MLTKTCELTENYRKITWHSRIVSRRRKTVNIFRDGFYSASAAKCALNDDPWQMPSFWIRISFSVGIKRRLNFGPASQTLAQNWGGVLPAAGVSWDRAWSCVRTALCCLFFCKPHLVFLSNTLQASPPGESNSGPVRVSTCQTDVSTTEPGLARMTNFQRVRTDYDVA